jgi:2-polyprenyl-6-methoxyphenol hydroxylase-like FAD-dependent oxidoreductase
VTIPSRVIVVGAGPVGLTAAFLLADAGVAVTVFESSSSIPHELRASTWHPPTLDMLELSGLSDVLIAHGRITPSWQIRLLETGERAEFDLSILSADTNHPYRLQCEQSAYCDAVVDRLRAMGHAELRFGETVAAAGQSDERAWVEAQRDGKRRERFEAAYVVGCDGARSVVREAMGARFEGSAYPEITILATTRFPFETVLEGLSGVNYIWKDGGTFSLLHLPALWRCAFYPELGQSPDAAVTDEAIQRQVDEISLEIGAIEIIEKRAYRVHQRIANTYRVGRLLIAGDAAHLNSPKGGMGMNGGIHDAFGLTGKMTAVLNGGAPALLDSYERQRRPIALEDIIAQADVNRARMNETDAAARRIALESLQAIAADPARARAFLLRSSMIEGLRKAEKLAEPA